MSHKIFFPQRMRPGLFAILSFGIPGLPAWIVCMALSASMFGVDDKTAINVGFLSACLASVPAYIFLVRATRRSGIKILSDRLEVRRIFGSVQIIPFHQIVSLRVDELRMLVSIIRKTTLVLVGGRDCSLPEVNDTDELVATIERRRLMPALR